MRVMHNPRSGGAADPPGISGCDASFEKVLAEVHNVPDVNVNVNGNVNVISGGKALGDSEVRRIPIVESGPASEGISTTTSLFGPDNSGGVVVGIGIGPNNGIPVQQQQQQLKKKKSYTNANVNTTGSAVTTSSSQIAHTAFVPQPGAGDYVTINNTAKCNGGSCSCSAAATPTSATHGLVPHSELHQPQQQINDISRVGVYNGIFLVDGLGHGVRIERQTTQQTGGLMSMAEGGHYEYGLPEQASGYGLRDRERQFYPTSTTTVMPTTPQHQHQPQLHNGEQNPVCIRIDAGTCMSPLVHSNPDTSRFCVGVTCPSQSSYFPGQTPEAGGAVIPVIPGCSSTSPGALVPKPTNRNSVTLPVPSPPLPQGNLSISSTVPLPSSPGLNVTGIALGIGSERGSPNIMSPTLNPRQSSVSLMERTLISTEAQTEDLPAATADNALTSLPPPPPPSRNREQRKRERRERRRADRSQSQNQNQNFHRSNGEPGPSRMPGHRFSSATPEPGNGNYNNNVIYANTNITQFGEQQQSMHLQPNGRNSQAFTEGGSNSCHGQGQLGLPDLLNSHLPPPYSTLPQTCERRVVLGNVPLHAQPVGSIPGHPHPLPHQLPHPVLQMPGMPPMPGFPPGGPPMLPPPQPILGPGPPTPGGVCMASPAQPVRYHFAPTARASRRSLRTPRGAPYASEEEPKSCCGMSTSQAVSIRWFIIVIAVIGICCTVAGTALGAARSAGSQHLTLSLLMIGVGVVLLTVSAVAWRLTANESGTSCRAMLGFARNGSSRGDGGAEPNRRFVPRLAPSYGRPHHPYAAMMYPDFQYRPPPPSYQASMQEYRLRLLLLERSNPTIAAAAGLGNPMSSSMVPPPPAYRPYTGLRPGGLRNDPDFTRPPSYRSRSSGGYSCQDSSPSSRPSGMEHHQHHSHMGTPIHSRDPSILSYLSQQSMGDNVSVVSGPGTNGQANGGVTPSVVTVMQAVSVGMDLGMMSPLAYDPSSEDRPENGENKELPEPNDYEEEGLGKKVVGGGGLVTNSEKSGLSKDGNLVRIVQTTDSSQVIGRNSVIVTVSGSNHSLWEQSLHNAVNNNANTNTNGMTNNSHHSTSGGNGQPSGHLENNEVQILAHL